MATTTKAKRRSDEDDSGGGEREEKNIRVVTPVFRLSFPNLAKPKSNFEGQKPAYSVQMLFKKEDEESLKEMKVAAHRAAVKKWGADFRKRVKFKHPTFKDGDEKELEDYKGKIVVEARTFHKPGVVDKDREEILDLTEVYAGCYCRATLTCYAYEKAGNKGVSFGLQNLQKIKDGPAFSGRKNAKDDFDDEVEFEIEDDETDMSGNDDGEDDFENEDEIPF